MRCIFRWSPINIHITITVSIPLLVDSQSPRVSSAQQSVLLSLCRYLCWWTLSPRGYHQLSSQCYYHCVDTSAGGHLVPEGIIRSVVSVTITVSIPLLVDYSSSRVSSAQYSQYVDTDIVYQIYLLSTFTIPK